MSRQESKNRGKAIDDRLKFLAGGRGQFIVSQALYLAIEKLKEVKPENLREESNIEDMEYLAEVFPMYFDIADSLKDLKTREERR